MIFSSEACHKILRFASKHLSRQNNNLVNAYDCFTHLWLISDPIVKADMEEYDSKPKDIERDGDDELVESFFLVFQ